MAIYIYFVTAPYATPGTEMVMLLFYNGLAESVVKPLQCGIAGTEVSLDEAV
jgi:hypothetical protein